MIRGSRFVNTSLEIDDRRGDFSTAAGKGYDLGRGPHSEGGGGGYQC